MSLKPVDPAAGRRAGSLDFKAVAALDIQVNNKSRVRLQYHALWLTARCICGLDPSLSGAISFYFPEAPDRIVAEDMPVVAGKVDAETLAARIAQMRPDLAVVASTFKFGKSYRAIIGVIATLQIRTLLVSPTVWKKHFRLDKDKEKSRALALRTFSKTPEHFARKRDHNRAEAAMLAAYGAFLEASSLRENSRPGCDRTADHIAISANLKPRT